MNASAESTPADATSLDDASASVPRAPWDSADAHLADLVDFVVASPSSYHAAEEVARRLVAAGATRIDETGRWPSAPGAYVLVRGGAAVAWMVPDGAADRAGDQTGDVAAVEAPDGGAAANASFRIVGSHTDSPGFRVKPNPNTGAAGYAQVAVEVYGGALLGAWTDREIEFAGRVVTRDGRAHLARTGPVARIPQLAIHLNRGVNDEGLKLDRQRHTTPVIGCTGDARAFHRMLGEAAGVEADDVVAWDLITCDTQRPRTFGVDGEFLACGRLDNLLSVHASLVAFEKLLDDGAASAGADTDSVSGSGSGSDSGSDSDSVVFPVMVAFDHEEVGSASTTGAAGPLLEDVLRRIAAAAGADEDGLHRMFRRSTCISADGAHAVHPNYSGEHEPGHWPLLDGGPVLKINANQRYATDAVGQGMFERVTAAAGAAAGETIPVQYFVSSNQKPCGSTIGPITATRLGISTVDVGAAMLSMHSPREMCGVRDPWWLARMAGAYWAGA